MLGCAILWFIINTMHISDCCQFSDSHISQGSVATHLRCGGIFKYEFVANLPVSLSVKEFWKSVNIWGSYGQEFSVLFFFETQCSSLSARISCVEISSSCFFCLSLACRREKTVFPRMPAKPVRRSGPGLPVQRQSDCLTAARTLQYCAR